MILQKMQVAILLDMRAYLKGNMWGIGNWVSGR
jgi:hypothetical protein